MQQYDYDMIKERFNTLEHRINMLERFVKELLLKDSIKESKILHILDTLNNGDKDGDD